MATERDPERVTWLDRHFSYELLQDGCLQPFLSPDEQETLERGWLEDPAFWAERDPGEIARILKKVRAQLEASNESLPIHHFLWSVDENGKKWGGGTRMNLPFGGMTLDPSEGPSVLLDGGHDDPAHRMELKRYSVRLDPERWGEFEAKLRQQGAAWGSEDSQGGAYFMAPLGSPGPLPLLEEPDGWIQVEPILHVAGETIAVQSEDALAMLGPSLDEAIAFCDHARAAGLPLFWLSG